MDNPEQNPTDNQTRLSQIEHELSQIKLRNVRVELNKAWETSLTRHLLLIGLTYSTTSIVFYIIGVDDVFKNALVPTTGFYLSTLSLPFAKKFWIARQLKLAKRNFEH